MPDSPPDSELSAWLRAHAGLVAGVAVVAVVAVVVMGVALARGSDGPVPVETIIPSDGVDTAVPREESAGLIAVKVDNSPAARPQIGINAARLVLEAPVEGGMTRFLALFEPGDTLVGPVRSARPVDVDLVPAFSDTLVSTGGRPFVLGPLRENGTRLAGTDPQDSPFQTLERPSPHNQFVSLTEVPSPGPGSGGFPAGDWPEEAEEAEEATEPVEVPYPEPVTWTFTDGLYSRSQDGEPFILLPDWGAEPEPLSTQTVVVMEVNQRSAGYSDVNGVDVPTFDVIGSGRMWVHHDGESLTGVWHRSSLADGYVLRNQDGAALGLPDGRAFVHLVPRSLLAG